MLALSFTVFVITLLAFAVAFFDSDLFSGIFGSENTKKKALFIFGIILALSFFGVVFNLEGFETSNTAKVTRVIDGDTVELTSRAKVRLIGIDAPEMGENYSFEAKRKLENIILGKEVRLERDVSDTDQYGRLLRYIWQDNVLVNELMVQNGFARAKSYPPDIKYQERLREAEREAREKKRGLWLDK